MLGVIQMPSKLSQYAAAVPVELVECLEQHLRTGSDLIQALPEFSTTMERLELYHLYTMSMLDAIHQYTKQQLATQMGNVEPTALRIKWVIKLSQQQAMAYWATNVLFKQHVKMFATLNLPIAMMNQVDGWFQNLIDRARLTQHFDS